MSGLYSVDTWETFLAQRDRVPSWKISFNIAVALHLVVFAGAVVLPDVGKRPEIDNVVVVDLLSLPPAAPAPEVEQQGVMPQAKKKELSVQQPEPVQRIEPQESQEPQAPDPVPEVVDSEPEKIEQVSEAPEPVPEIAPEPKIRHQSRPQSIAQAKPVSLRPLKRKKKLAEDVRLAEVKEQEAKKKKQAQERRAQLAALERKRLAEQRKREQVAEEEKRRIARKKKQQQAAAKRRQAELQAEQRRRERRREREIAEAARLARQAEQAAEQARLEAAALKREYASVSQAVSSLNTPISSRASRGAADSRGWGGNGVYSGSGSEQGNPAVLKQYIASLHGRITNNWQLPEILKKESHLRAMVALTIGRDGSIKDMRIERKSGNSIFDQSVLKALQNSAPFPDFPVLIDTSTLEFALNFTPQGLAF